ncbi:MAG: hypothetical protein GTO53_10865 [Planctomycetales bacterium]|nr:hypothetical protein [Planctomycetales bacterium]NIM09620.1 hypothetical protein [Planctomycetales bacterium]NIN09103.1 hypothetical protein [Planctomycetales bacterium]NIN78210.1 hypothetical protein [Planctomycetales bacterium]NIO35401.1 hypothetical protein [Planctomycetales bacterium]
MKVRLNLLLTLATCLPILLTCWAFSSRTTGQEAAAPLRPLLDREDARPLMRAKLASSQRVFEGLLTKDFAQIRKGADELVRITDVAAWQNIDDPVHKHYHAEFRRLIIRLRGLAEKANLEGASFLYMQSVSTCINCHEHVRDVQKIANGGEGEPGAIRLLGERF